MLAFMSLLVLLVLSDVNVSLVSGQGVGAGVQVPCGNAAFNLTGLSNLDFYYTDPLNLYVYAYRPCAPSPLCVNQASACQLIIRNVINPVTNTSNQYTLSLANGSTDCSTNNNAPGCFTYTNLYATPSNNLVPLGLRIVQNPNGVSTSCSKARGIIVNFLCSPSSIPVLASVIDEGCLYEFTIYTNLACS